MRTVYLGTSEFAATILGRLAATSHRPTLVVTRPDRPKGRGRKLASPPAAERARELGIELIQPESVNSPEAREAIAAAAPEVVCICAYGGLIKEPLLSDYEMLNVHPSLLPRWRGAAPVERAIEAGDAETGVSIMRPTAELDAGPVCLQGALPIGPEDDYAALAGRLEQLGADLLIEALERRPAFIEQPDAGITYAKKIEPEDRRLDPARPASELERLVRALSPHVGAWLELPGGERLAVERAVSLEAEAGEPGALRASGDSLLLACGVGALELLVVKPPGKRAMDAASYLRGNPAAVERSP